MQTLRYGEAMAFIFALATVYADLRAWGSYGSFVPIIQLLC